MVAAGKLVEPILGLNPQLERRACDGVVRELGQLEVVGRAGYRHAPPTLQHGGAGVEKILRANIGDSAREAILAGNAQRLLGITL